MKVRCMTPYHVDHKYVSALAKINIIMAPVDEVDDGKTYQQKHDHHDWTYP